MSNIQFRLKWWVKLVLKVSVGLVVVFVLLQLLFPLSGSRIQPAARKAMARNDIANLITAIKAYRIEYGTLPLGDEIAIISILQGKNARAIVFFYAPVKQFDPQGRFLDPWKSPYRMDLSDLANPKIWSPGPNKKDEPDDPKSDDIRSWQ